MSVHRYYLVLQLVLALIAVSFFIVFLFSLYSFVVAILDIKRPPPPLREEAQ